MSNNFEMTKTHHMFLACDDLRNYYQSQDTYKDKYSLPICLEGYLSELLKEKEEIHLGKNYVKCQVGYRIIDNESVLTIKLGHIYANFTDFMNFKLMYDSSYEE